MDNPTRIYCDNQAARTVAHNPTSLKHVAAVIDKQLHRTLMQSRNRL